MVLLVSSPDQPAVSCLECHTKLGVGTTKDVFSHLVTCLKVKPNTLRNIKDNAVSERSEHGHRVLHIVNALLGEKDE